MILSCSVDLEMDAEGQVSLIIDIGDVDDGLDVQEKPLGYVLDCARDCPECLVPRLLELQGKWRDASTFDRACVREAVETYEESRGLK